MQYYKTFLDYLNQEDKDLSVQYALGLLEDKKMNIVRLYEEVLAPALNNFNNHPNEMCIWKEHIRTNIIRTIVECSFPYIYKEKNKPINKTVIVVCPEAEHHEIGARMAVDFFTLSGYKTYFIGAITPEETLLDAIKELKPNYVAFSITYDKSTKKIKKIIKDIEKMHLPIKVIVGGNAVKNENSISKELNAIIINSFEAIKNLKKHS